jgi:hypothetical protein
VEDGHVNESTMGLGVAVVEQVATGGETRETALLEVMVGGLVSREAEWVDVHALQIKTLLNVSLSRTIS